jgi:hypothetical protein
MDETPRPQARDDLADLTGLPGGRGLNFAYEAVDRHVLGGVVA